MSQELGNYLTFESITTFNFFVVLGLVTLFAILIWGIIKFSTRQVSNGPF